MQKKWRILIGSLAIIAVPMITHAVVTGTPILNDTFTDTNKVDMNTTTASVDTGNEWVTLGHAPQANVIASQSQNGGLPSDIVVADQSGVNWYSYDQTTGKMVKNTAMSPTAYTNPLGVALVPSSKSFYVFDGAGVHQAVFNGAGAVDNPIMAVSGLSNLISVTGVTDTSFATIDKSGNVSAYTYDQASNHPIKDNAHSFSTGLSGVVAVKNIPGTFNYVVFTKKNAYQYVFDQASGTYMQNSAYTVTSNGATVAGDSNSSGNLLTMLSPSQGTAYAFDQSSNKMAQSNILSSGSLSNAIALSMPSDTTDVIASSDGKIQTYQYNQSTNSMVANSNLLISGFTFVTQYDSSDVYQSMPVDAGQQNMFRLTTQEQNDLNTSISYRISYDGGGSFTAINTGTWTHLPAGTFSTPIGANVANGSYVLQAILTSGTANATPRLKQVTLEGYLDVTPPTAPTQLAANPNPSGSTSTMITWAPSDDPVQSPSTGASGVADYLIRFSTDGGQTWGAWIDTGTTQTSYQLAVPPNTVLNESFQVEPIDAAGNIGVPSGVGSVFIDTKPLIMDSMQITNITAPGAKQTTPLPISPPVYVQSGGAAVLQIETEGAAQSTTMQVLGNLSAGLYLSNPVQMLPSDTPSLSDTNTWTGHYLVPLTWADGTPIPSGTSLQVIININGLNGQVITKTVTIVVTDGAVNNSTDSKAHLG